MNLLQLSRNQPTDQIKVETQMRKNKIRSSPRSQRKSSQAFPCPSPDTTSQTVTAVTLTPNSDFPASWIHKRSYQYLREANIASIFYNHYQFIFCFLIYRRTRGQLQGMLIKRWVES